MTHPDTPELEGILNEFAFNLSLTGNSIGGLDREQAKASLTRLLAKRELEGRIAALEQLDNETKDYVYVERDGYLKHHLAELREELAGYD